MSVPVLVLALDKVLLVVDDSSARYDSPDWDEDNAGMKYYKNIQIDTITSVAISSYRDGFTSAPSQFDVHFDESNLEALGEFNDTLITLVRNQKICKHLGQKGQTSTIRASNSSSPDTFLTKTLKIQKTATTPKGNFLQWSK